MMQILVLFGVLFGQAANPVLPDGVDIPSFPGAEVFPMGDAARINGRGLRIYYFVTAADLNEVVEYYQRLWSDAGQIVAVNRTGDMGAAVGYLDLTSGLARSVTLFREGKRVFGFPAVLESGSSPFGPVAAGNSDLPIYPSAEGVLTYESLEAGASFRTVTYADRDNLAKNESFFLRELGKQGWQLAGRQPGENSDPTVMLDFTKGHQRINVTLAWLPRDSTCSVFLVANFGAGRAREERP